MRRSDLIKLVGVSAEFFNSLARRDQLPFLKRLLGEQKGWGDYPPHYAYMSSLALALSDAGCTQYQAGHFIDLHFQDLLQAGLDRGEGQGADIYFGYLKSVTLTFDGQAQGFEGVATSIPLCGQLSQLLPEIEHIKSKMGAKAEDALVLVNASACLRLLRERAAEWAIGEEIILPAIQGEEG